MKNSIESYPTDPSDEERIDSLGHILRAGRAIEGDDDFNDKIDVFRVATEGDRAQVYQMWAVDKFASNGLAYDAVETFGLVGDGVEKEKWTQLLEHISGVTAIADHLEALLEKYGAEHIDRSSIEAATLFDNINKPLAVEAGVEMRTDSPLETAVLVHDIEKPAEVAAAKEMAKEGGAGGLENSRDNPVLREGRLWSYLQEKGVRDDVLLAAQNTGRSDRFFSELDEYEGDAVKKAIQDRENLAQLLGIDRDGVDAMTATERRRASIETKGRLAALVGISDALAAQFRFRGMTEENIDAMSAHYLTYKKDPESVAFFGKDWPEYYKEVRNYLIDQVPEGNRPAFITELDGLNERTIFNETILPEILGDHAMGVSARKHAAGEPNAYDRLRYPEH